MKFRMEYKDENLLGALGLIFPENPDQLEEFDKVYSSYQYEAKPEAVNPLRILNSIKLKEAKGTNKDFHKRVVLAAEIVYQLKENRSMGHLKLEKILYLCLNAKNINVFSNFLRQAMGPYDPSLMRSIDKQFYTRRWFHYNRDSFPKYSPLEKAGEHKEWYNKYFGHQVTEIDHLIDLFRPFTSDQIELVATLFACWKDMVEDKIEFDLDYLKRKFYAWSEDKKKFTEDQMQNAVEWMREKGIYPLV